MMCVFQIFPGEEAVYLHFVIDERRTCLRPVFIRDWLSVVLKAFDLDGSRLIRFEFVAR